jgi:hypothetical protein
LRFDGGGANGSKTRTVNRTTETELREIARGDLDLAPEPRETLAQALSVSVRRLFYLLKLWAAVAIGYVVARALLG